MQITLKDGVAKMIEGSFGLQIIVIVGILIEETSIA